MDKTFGKPLLPDYESERVIRQTLKDWYISKKKKKEEEQLFGDLLQNGSIQET